jgi:hypothetical protein
MKRAQTSKEEFDSSVHSTICGKFHHSSCKRSPGERAKTTVYRRTQKRYKKTRDKYQSALLLTRPRHAPNRHVPPEHRGCRRLSNGSHYQRSARSIQNISARQIDSRVMPRSRTRKTHLDKIVAARSCQTLQHGRLSAALSIQGV